MIYEVLYYIFVLLFGVYVCMRIACGRLNRLQWRLMALLSPLLLLLQGTALVLWGMETVRLLYPLITHLPIVLTLVTYGKISLDRAMVGVLISYSLCQLPRWAGLLVYGLGMQGAAAFFVHLALSCLMLALLDRYCLSPMHDVAVGFAHPLAGVGALPMVYYLYEYFMVYTDRRFAGIEAMSELIPTAMVLFFVFFVLFYHREMERRRQARQQAAHLEMELTQAGQEVRLLRTLQDQTAIHRHDLRHHLAMIDSLISTDRIQQASDYIHRVSDEVQALSPKRFCENEIANLLLGSFDSRAAGMKVKLACDVRLPGDLPIGDSELCALLSNGLENAINAASELAEGSRVELFCGVRQEKLLIEIKNPFCGAICMENGIPQGVDGQSHYGCRSIQSIVQRHRGLCVFEANGTLFTLRVVIPMKADCEP